jgi:hypothetical protein
MDQVTASLIASRIIDLLANRADVTTCHVTPEPYRASLYHPVNLLSSQSPDCIKASWVIAVKARLDPTQPTPRNEVMLQLEAACAEAASPCISTTYGGFRVNAYHRRGAARSREQLLCVTVFSTEVDHVS